MVDMKRSVKVKIRPHISPDNAAKLIHVIADKLWPNNHAGGATWLIRGKIKNIVAGLCLECHKRQKTVEFRVKREGMSITVEPLEANT